MKTFTTPIEKTANCSFYFGTFPKTNVTGNKGDTFKIIGETKTYYITENKRNSKLPKWIFE
jgi:hypothetical protein